MSAYEKVVSHWECDRFIPDYLTKDELQGVQKELTEEAHDEGLKEAVAKAIETAPTEKPRHAFIPAQRYDVV